MNFSEKLENFKNQHRSCVNAIVFLRFVVLMILVSGLFLNIITTPFAEQFIDKRCLKCQEGEKIHIAQKYDGSYDITCLIGNETQIFNVDDRDIDYNCAVISRNLWLLVSIGITCTFLIVLLIFFYMCRYFVRNIKENTYGLSDQFVEGTTEIYRTEGDINTNEKIKATELGDPPIIDTTAINYVEDEYKQL